MMENKYLERLKETTVSAFEGEKVKIILFGSRARQDNCRTSDVDVGLIPRGKLNKRKVILLKEKLEDLNIPYKVEIVDFSEVSLDFKKEAMNGAVVWKDSN